MVTCFPQLLDKKRPQNWRTPKFKNHSYYLIKDSPRGSRKSVYGEQSAHFFRGVVETKTPDPFSMGHIYILYIPRYVPLKHKVDLPCLHKSINLQSLPKPLTLSNLSGQYVKSKQLPLHHEYNSTFLHGPDAVSVIYTGSVTMDSPTWTRPTDCDSDTDTPVSLVVGYTVESFNVLTTGLFDVTIEVNSVQDFDGYIFVYQDVFNPMVPDANLLNDDVGFRISSLTVNLQCGTQYFVVTTAYDGDV